MKKTWLCAVLTAGLTVNLVAADVAAEAKTALDKVTANTITYVDANGWLYSKNELVHLAKGELAKGAAAQKSASSKPQNADPIPALSAFNNDLKALGIQLIVVPVPPKAAAEPFGALKRGDAMGYLKPFYEELRAAGVTVLDLSDAFAANPESHFYCRTDAHWNPAGIAVAAEALAKGIELRGKTEFALHPSPRTLSGDLAQSLAKDAPQTEEIAMQSVAGAIDENSPVLLIGDSHTLVFSTGGDMLAEDAGLAEMLASKLGMPVDRIGVKGSAATAVRINLFRKAAKNPAWLKNKKYVIYCFACREFTESSSGWVKVPVLKK